MICDTCTRRRGLNDFCPSPLPNEGEDCEMYRQAEWAKVKQLEAEIEIKEVSWKILSGMNCQWYNLARRYAPKEEVKKIEKGVNDSIDYVKQSELKIEQLQAELAEARKVNFRWQVIAQERREAIERLKNALNEISNYDLEKGCGIDCRTYACTCRNHLIDIADNVLKAGE